MWQALNNNYRFYSVFQYNKRDEEPAILTLQNVS